MPHIKRSIVLRCAAYQGEQARGGDEIPIAVPAIVQKASTGDTFAGTVKNVAIEK